MLSDQTGQFTKDNPDALLKELAKEFRKLNGTAVPAEVILIGGAAVLAGYGFREMTTDVDAVIHASSSLKAKKPSVLGQLKENRERLEPSEQKEKEDDRNWER